MKFYSEKLDKIFDTEEELVAAESTTKNNKKKKSQSSSTVSTEPPSEQSELAKLEASVAEKSQKVEEAKNAMALAEKKVYELSNSYLTEVESILRPAKEALKHAQDEFNLEVTRLNQLRASEEHSSSLASNSTKNLEKVLALWDILWI